MKRLLALDGGGIRGIFCLQILAKIEMLFRKLRNRPNLVLADEFDGFAGTSTGAIIATGLAWGMPVSDIESQYLHHGPEIFARAPWYRRFYSKYRAESIAEFFRNLYSDENQQPALLGSPDLRKLVIMVMRNATTGSTWPLSNHPLSLYNDPSRPDCNLTIPLWQLVCASAAAPSFFPPMEINIGSERHLFLDGAVSPFNNPALIAMLMVTLPGYRVCWPSGRENLHIISVGTGSHRSTIAHRRAGKVNLLHQLEHVVPALISSVSQQQDAICRILGDCLYGALLDSELGTLTEPSLLDSAQQRFTYVRYDQDLDQLDSRKLRRHETAIDNLRLMPTLRDIGQEYADSHVRFEHLWPRGQSPLDGQGKPVVQAG
jgi:patatin-like phospholipase/acyl hydrolase